MAQDYDKIFIKGFLELSKEKGYAKISIVDLTEHCGTSRQTFYYYYKSIDDLIIKSVNSEIDAICNSIDENSTWYESAIKIIKVLEKYQDVIKSALQSKHSLKAIDLIDTNADKFIRAFVKAKHTENKFTEFLFTCCRYTFTGLIISEMKNEKPDLMNVINNIDEKLINTD